jgi:chemotaxis protein MotB
MATTLGRGRNEPPPPAPIIVKKIIVEEHGAHHGGAWKIAYADFVTAMMAFFLLLWLVGAVDETQRRGLADYFTPTVIEYRQNSAGADGIMSGSSIVEAENYPNRAGQTGSRAIVIPRDATGGQQEATPEERQRQLERFAELRAELLRRIDASPQLRRLRDHVSFTQTDQGLRIDLVDEADFSMFEVGTDRLLPDARQLVREVAQVIAGVDNNVVVRGHTDSRPYGGGRGMNNWLLSTARAETTRGVLEQTGVTLARFTRLEGVADREPFVPSDRLDPRNRRISITLAWSGGAGGQRPAPPAPSQTQSPR